MFLNKRVPKLQLHPTSVKIFPANCSPTTQIYLTILLMLIRVINSIFFRNINTAYSASTRRAMASSAVVPHNEITKEQFASHLSQYPALLEAISESKGGT
jgi:hypothetical protein